jgi:hypothetical protein
MAARRRPAKRRRVRLAAVLTAGAGLLLAALPACAAQAGESAAAPSATTASIPAAAPSTTAPKAVAGDDWRHVLQVVANLRAHPPAEPIVVLLGGSAARESTVSDSSWAAQIQADGGPATAAFNLGSRNRTLAQDVALVKKLPQAPGIVYIGINVGRFTSPPSSPTINLPEPVATLPPYVQHQYTQSAVKSVVKKKALLNEWLARRYPAFKANYATSLKTLGTLVDACRSRGYRPVLLELPRDTAVIGPSLDAPLKRFTADCKALARKKGAVWVSFVTQARLPDRDFYDLWHLVEPGREVWQGLLSKETVRLLEQYGMEGAGS